ncbi:MAG: malonyl-ACP O-methyltransferase BioC [Methylococcaceae bacterium]|nr:malonyl-ACP O-methyltransferase BioC [Methylococcaceae bacterium]
MRATFSIDKDKVRHSFSSAVSTYDSFASLQRKVGLELLNKSESFAEKIILDIGCGTGFLAQELFLKSLVKQMIAVDVALPMVQATKNKLESEGAVQYICADAEKLPLLEGIADQIISNLALQWCQNLTTVFKGFKRILKQDGQILFSTFGPATLQELKTSWAEVDCYTHVNNFYSVDKLILFLEQADFRGVHTEVKRYQSKYRTVIELMRELKGIGAHNVLSGRNRGMTSKAQMLKMVNAYEKHKVNNFIPATYEIIFVSANI